jgi:hypothetical protein
MMSAPSAYPKHLTSTERRKWLRPWRKAEELTRCQLFWLPADFPAPSQQRQWILAFLDAFSETVQKKFSLEPQTFIQMRTIYPHLQNDFIKTAMEFNPLFGLGRRPMSKVPELPDMRYVEDLQKGRRSFAFGDGLADYCYWFIGRQERPQRRLFLGFGGLTIMFTKKDPNTVPPPGPSIPPGVRRSPIFESVLKQWEPERGLQTAYALKGAFLAKSKEHFGRGLEEDPQYPGLLYVLPLLSSSDFFDQKDDDANHWFDVFNIYVNESAGDNGILLASKEDCEEDIAGIVETLRRQGMRYPEQVGGAG